MSNAPANVSYSGTQGSEIALYHDEGSGELTRGCLAHALASTFAPARRVRRVYAAELSSSDAWHARTVLLALPGGADLPYCQRLNGAGNASILRYLRGGGALLAVCAGAYYSAARICFEPRHPGQITGTRELALFQGTAQGSLHDLAAPYSVSHLRCAEVVRVRCEVSGRELHTLYWGGPELVPDPDAAFTPLLRYVTPDGRASLAAVRVQVGRGRAVLTGVHAEVLGCQLAIEVSRYPDDSFEHGMRVSQALTRHEAERQALWSLLVNALGC